MRGRGITQIVPNWLTRLPTNTTITHALFAPGPLGMKKLVG